MNYILRSKKSDSLQLLIQLQISNDTELLSEVLQANKQAHKTEESGGSCLTNISQQLTKIESSKCKKTTDTRDTKIKSTQANKINDTTPLNQNMPQLSVRRQNILIQTLVDKQLKELAEVEKTGIKQKSLRGGPVEVLVPNRVKWLHEYILSGSHKECIS